MSCWEERLKAAKASIDPSSHLPILVGDPGFSKDVGRALLKERRDTPLNPDIRSISDRLSSLGSFDHMLPKLLEIFQCQVLPPNIRSDISRHTKA